MNALQILIIIKELKIIKQIKEQKPLLMGAYSHVFCPLQNSRGGAWMA